MKKLTMTIILEMTDKDYLKNEITEIDPLIVTRELLKNNVEHEDYENGIISFAVPKEILSKFKKSNADIAEISIIDNSNTSCIDNNENGFIYTGTDKQ